jgi:hypothetical protein
VQLVKWAKKPSHVEKNGERERVETERNREVVVVMGGGGGGTKKKKKIFKKN